MTKKELINRLINDPIQTLSNLSNQQIASILEDADEAFFNTNTTLFTDDMYDIIKDHLRKKDPKNAYLKKVGANIEFNKEALPYYMGSLDKIKDSEKEILKWQDKYKGNYIISEKLDGISCLVYHDKGVTKLLTRGNGVEGQNITHILPYLNTKFPSFTQKTAIRGELIISKTNWEKISHLGANARNVVAGAVHSKTVNRDIVSKIDFISYDTMWPRKKLSESLNSIEELQLPVVKHIKTASISLEFLSDTLQKWRKESSYEIDGIVIYHDEDHKIISGKNPKYAFAFKTVLTQERAEVIVTDVEWNVSKHRYLKPLVKFNEVSISGVKIKQASGFNASYIQKNNIGPGSRIIVIRSGDVIPHILEVLSVSSNGKPKMPDSTVVKYEWNDTGVDIMLIGEEKNKEHDIKAFAHFMNTLSVEGVKEGVLSKLYDAGFDTLPKIINITIEDLNKIPGFQQKGSQKVYDALNGITATVASQYEKLLTASNAFGRGFGEKKFKLITDEYPFIAYDKKRSKELTISDLTKIKGIAETTAKLFIDNLPKFYEFCDDLGMVYKDNKRSAVVENAQINDKLKIFNDKKVVFTGFRDKNYEQIIEANGGKVMTTVTKQTDILIVKNASENNTKIMKAREQGITIMAKDEFETLLS
jgi:NAD-dependent DNA ligase